MRLNCRTVAIVVFVVTMIVLGVVLIMDYYGEEDTFALPDADALSQTQDDLTIRVLGIAEEYWADESASEMYRLHTFPATAGVRVWTEVLVPEDLDTVAFLAELETTDGRTVVNGVSGNSAFFPEVRLSQVKSLTWIQEIPIYAQIELKDLPVTADSSFPFTVLVDGQETTTEVTVKKDQVFADQLVDEISLTVAIPVREGESVVHGGYSDYVMGDDGKEYKLAKFDSGGETEGDTYSLVLNLSIESLQDTVKSISYAYKVRIGAEQQWTFTFDLPNTV